MSITAGDSRRLRRDVSYDVSIRSGKRTTRERAINIYTRVAFPFGPLPSQRSDVARFTFRGAYSPPTRNLFITEHRDDIRAIRKNRIESGPSSFLVVVIRDTRFSACLPSSSLTARCTIDFCSLRTGSANCGGHRRTPRVFARLLPPLSLSLSPRTPFPAHLSGLRCLLFLSGLRAGFGSRCPFGRP